MKKSMKLPVQRNLLHKIGAFIARSYGGHCIATCVNEDEAMVRFQVTADTSTFRVGVPFVDLNWYLKQAEAAGL